MFYEIGSTFKPATPVRLQANGVGAKKKNKKHQ